MYCDVALGEACAESAIPHLRKARTKSSLLDFKNESPFDRTLISVGCCLEALLGARFEASFGA